MPKEVVYGSLEPFGDDDPNTSLVEVRWNKETEYMQLATVCVARSNHEPVTQEISGGMYISLDRRGINDLIRHLRRARDQAYGRDE